MNKIILCAGHGYRFSKQGIKQPKPLFQINNFPLLWWSARSAIKSFKVKNLYFAVLNKHIDEFGIDEEILKYFPSAKIITIKDVTKGAAETAFLASSFVNNNEPISFMDCDFFFNSNKIDLSKLNNNQYYIFTFKSSDPNYSFALIKNNIVIKIKEKKVISNDAIAGIYIFSNKTNYINLYQKFLKKNPNDEYYLSNILNIILDNNKDIVYNHKLDSHLSMGTPLEISKININDLDNAFNILND